MVDGEKKLVLYKIANRIHKRNKKLILVILNVRVCDYPLHYHT